MTPINPPISKGWEERKGGPWNELKKDYFWPSSHSQPELRCDYENDHMKIWDRESEVQMKGKMMSLFCPKLFTPKVAKLNSTHALVYKRVWLQCESYTRYQLKRLQTTTRCFTQQAESIFLHRPVSVMTQAQLLFFLSRAMWHGEHQKGSLARSCTVLAYFPLKEKAGVCIICFKIQANSMYLKLTSTSVYSRVYTRISSVVCPTSAMGKV